MFIGKAEREKEVKSDGTTVKRFDDYYFFTEPDEFVTKVMAENPSWQLVHKTYDLNKFSRIPFIQRNYFHHGLSIVSEFSGKLESVKGRASVCIKGPHDDWKGGHLTYHLFFNDEESAEVISPEKQLSNYVIMQRLKDRWIFDVHFPVVGVYKLKLKVETSRLKSIVCEFKLYGNEMRDEPIPCSVGEIGWGPNVMTENGGMSNPSQAKGVVFVSIHKVVNFTFNIRRKLFVRAVLVKDGVDDGILNKAVRRKKTMNKDKLDVDVTLTDQGQYALRFFAKNKKTNEEDNVCNYLLNTESPTKKRNEVC